MKKIFFLIGLISFSTLFSQENNTEKVWKVNFLNPGIEYEVPTGKKSTFSAEFGVGFNVDYPRTGSEGVSKLISPFFDIQHKWFYNLDKRNIKGLNTSLNSGNFISARILTRSELLSGTDKTDFAVGPTWGIQRKYGENFHFLFDMGPIYYFDTNGEGYYFPLMIQLNLGFDL